MRPYLLNMWFFIFIFSDQHSPGQVSASEVGPFSLFLRILITMLHLTSSWCKALTYEALNHVHGYVIHGWSFRVRQRIDSFRVLETKSWEIGNGPVFWRMRRDQRKVHFPLLVATTAESDFRRGGPRWRSGEMVWSGLEEHVNSAFKSINLGQSTPLSLDCFWLGLFHSKPNEIDVSP